LDVLNLRHLLLGKVTFPSIYVARACPLTDVYFDLPHFRVEPFCLMLVRSLILFLFIICFNYYGLGKTEHAGFIGGPFHGVVQDPKNEVSLQLGPTADLTVPEGLVAHAEQSQVSSGGQSRLRASLRLDDGTYTVLDPSVVEWVLALQSCRWKTVP
jgi:hypothetical protein